MKRFLYHVFAAFVFMIGLTYYYGKNGPEVPETAAAHFDLQSLRSRADAAGPTNIAFEEVATGKMPEFLIHKGGGLTPQELPMYAVELQWSDRTVLIDPGTDKACGDTYAPGIVIHEEAYRNMEAAMERAESIVITHEHYDHMCAIAAHDNLANILPSVKLTEEQLASDITANGFYGSGGNALRDGAQPLVYEDEIQIAPGVFLIKAPGHTPGTQWVYVRTEQGEEYLFVGDTAWQYSYITEPTYKPWLSIAVVGEDAHQQTSHMRFLHDLHKAHPELHIIVAHDRALWEEAQANGLLAKGF